MSHVWLVAIAINAINATIFWVRAQPDIQQTPILKTGYIKLLLGFFVGLSLPWIVVGVGTTLGEIESIADYFYVREGNPSVVALWIVIWALILSFSQWLWFQNGAEILLRHPAILRSNSLNLESVSPKFLKLTWLAMLVMFIVPHVTILWLMKPR
ncbi:MAG: hypothetical protein AAGC93_27565 [Cyanobacteria bacterium P01_F01_bin.53]